MLAFCSCSSRPGSLRSRRWRPAAWFAGGVFALAAVWLLIAATSAWAHPFTSPPASGLTALLYLMTAFLISAALLVSVAALVVRFVKSSGEERLQLKWCAAAALVLVVVFVVSIWVELGGRERAAEPGVSCACGRPSPSRS